MHTMQGLLQIPRMAFRWRIAHDRSCRGSNGSRGGIGGLKCRVRKSPLFETIFFETIFRQRPDNRRPGQRSERQRSKKQRSKRASLNKVRLKKRWLGRGRLVDSGGSCRVGATGSVCLLNMVHFNTVRFNMLRFKMVRFGRGVFGQGWSENLHDRGPSCISRPDARYRIISEGLVRGWNGTQRRCISFGVVGYAGRARPCQVLGARMRRVCDQRDRNKQGNGHSGRACRPRGVRRIALVGVPGRPSFGLCRWRLRPGTCRLAKEAQNLREARPG